MEAHWETSVLAADLDDLTGLGRTGTFQAALDARGPSSPADDGALGGAGGDFSVALVDIVGLRHINRDHGTDAGDDLLRQVAERLVTSGFAQLVARVGDDEFALLADGVGAEEGGQRARALRRGALSEPFSIAGRPLEFEFHVTTRSGPASLGRDLLWQVEREALVDGTRALWRQLDALQKSVTELGALVDENQRLREHVEMLRDLAMRDPLTRLFNRRGMSERLEEPPVPRALAFVDLDDLRLLNSLDELWEAGDTAITGVADRLREAFGDRNVARWGGDEYLVVGDSSPGEMAGVLARVLAQCREELVVSGCPIGFSAGVAGSARGLPGAREMAQRALRKAKDAGPATVVVDDH